MPALSSTSTSHAVYHGPLPLYRVAFEGERTAHWLCSFRTLLHVPTAFWSTLEYKSKSAAEPIPESFAHPFADPIALASGKVHAQMAPLPPAPKRWLESQLRWAAEEVFNGKWYNALTNNCQHFFIDVVTHLHQKYPQSVPRSAVEDVLARAQGLTNISYVLRRTQLHEEGTDAESDRGDRPRFSID
ncbi:hypothetical protein MAC_02793 [Metarhizium acridum CQMa 102]|uniref:PPPDE domain-containing protein n=1 Tax=Metarhizium acridum (strain CQMa 102) TaxID=655827 RepID=E9DYU5_METAQ|nr:uncharacterized protein MAC_02793 [Metarhizium acridum CQMa 102]EFY91122.1 hypothetical protein MAC_02793 [Metarhizium acridum CQMa 102]